MPSQLQIAMHFGAAADVFFDKKKTELIPVHGCKPCNYSRPDVWGNEIRRQYGWYLVGRGAYACVFEHPYDPNLVIKVGQDMADGWLSYAAFCMRNWAPGSRLLEVHEIVLHEHCYVAVMEKLEPWRDLGIHRDRVDHERALATSMWRTLSDHIIAKMYNELGPAHDLHDANIMVRSDRSLVWTDPYADMTGKEHYSNYRQGERIVRSRTVLAPQSESTPVRADEEDNMLRLKPEHDNRALGKRVQSALLPGPVARRVRSAGTDPLDAAIGAAKRGSTSNARRRDQERRHAEGLYRFIRNDYILPRMVRPRRDLDINGEYVRYPILPAIKPNLRPPTDLYRLVNCGVDEKALRRRAEVPDVGKAIGDVLVKADFAEIEKRVLGNNGGRAIVDTYRPKLAVGCTTRHLNEWFGPPDRPDLRGAEPKAGDMA